MHVGIYLYIHTQNGSKKSARIYFKWLVRMTGHANSPIFWSIQRFQNILMMVNLFFGFFNCVHVASMNLQKISLWKTKFAQSEKYPQNIRKSLLADHICYRSFSTLPWPPSCHLQNISFLFWNIRLLYFFIKA